MSEAPITHTGLWNRIIEVFIKQARRDKREYVDLRPTAVAQLLGENAKRISDAMRQMSERQMLARLEITRFNGKETAAREKYLYRLACVKPQAEFTPLKTSLYGRPIVPRDQFDPPKATVNRSAYDTPLDTPVPALAGREKIKFHEAPKPQPKKSRVKPIAPMAPPSIDRSVAKPVWKLRQNGSLSIKHDSQEIVLARDQVAAIAKQVVVTML